MTKIPNLFALMKARNITAKNISENTGISAGNISDWKSGRSAPTIDKIKLLANYFNVSTDYLLGRSDEKQPTNKEDDVDLLTAQIAAYGDPRDFNDKELEEIKAFIEFVKSKRNK